MRDQVQAEAGPRLDWWDRLRFWLIELLADGSPVVLNVRVTVPRGYPVWTRFQGVRVGTRPALVKLAAIVADDNEFKRARAVVSAD